MNLVSGALRRVSQLAFALVVALSLTSTLFAQASRPTGTNYLAKRSSGSRAVTPATGVAELLQCLVGPDVAVSKETLTASPTAAGTFTGGLDVVGFDQGIILSSGDVSTLTGPNVGDSTSTVNTGSSDPDLESLIPGYTTFDAVVLEFDFVCATAQDVVFQYVFGSEEYNEYVNTPFNDVFGFFLNGTNIALAPAGCSGAGAAVSINNVNCGNPYVAAGPNCNCYRNNDLEDGGGSLDTELDGLTQVFHATGTIHSGTNHIKIALSDAGDQVLDSDVMIRCQSFTCGSAPVTGACCLPAGSCVTLTSADCSANGGTYHGDETSCVPSPCGTSSGACCFPDDSCQVESPVACDTDGGTYQSDGAPCVPNPCGAPIGACCFGPGSCELTDSFSCIGTWVGGGTDCSPDPCTDLTGACCADLAACELKSQSGCHDTFLGVGTACDPNPCEEILGACCHDTGFCEVTLEADCGDFYQGNRTVCDPTPCAAFGDLIFADGFESGDTKKWSATVPPG